MLGSDSSDYEPERHDSELLLAGKQEPAPQETMDDVSISLNALSGNSSFQTLKLQGTVKNHTLIMLVDCVSTHNFLDANTAKSFGCNILHVNAHDMAVAGGGKLKCNVVCSDISWVINGLVFISDV